MKDLYEYHIFLNLYVSAISDCPLSARNIEASFKHLKTISVKHGAPVEAYIAANPEPHHFTYLWTFEYQNANIAPTTTPCMMHVTLRNERGEIVPIATYYGKHK